MNRTSITHRVRHARTAVLGLTALLLGAQLASSGAATAAPPTAVLVTGELERVFLNAPGDLYAGGQLVVGGHSIVVPRNLLVDLPANRLTLQQIFAQAPQACVATSETGLAKTDACNASHTGAVVTVHANRTRAGDVVAGDVYVQKAVEIVNGTITHIDYDQGWFAINGDPAQADTGVKVRLNDPTGRHTVQTGPGCLAGSPNCSPDPRFQLDADNYTNKFSTGYPLCVPSTQPRSFTDSLDFDGRPATTTLVAQAKPDGTGDVLCPDTNRSSTGQYVEDSRRLAPVKVGDWISVTGNFETVDGVRFLSVHSSTVSVALLTRNAPGQPDYMYLSEVGIDAPGFNQQRIRARFFGVATDPVPDVLLWSIHRDPGHNADHEFPLGTTRGCDLSGGNCTNLVAGLWRIRYDSDFIRQPTGAKLSPCAQLRRDVRMGTNLCPDRPGDDEFAVLSPLPHELQARTGRKVADTGGELRTFDVQGHEATNGQFLFPLGIGLGGIEMPDLAEVNLNKLSSPNIFEGVPWLMDRRLSPGGCQGVGGCESSVQPLDPFPLSGLDPRTQAVNSLAPGGPTPNGLLTDPAFTATPLSNVSNRTLSFVDPALGNFNGDSSVLKYPPNDPGSQGIVPTPPVGAAGPLISGFAPTTATPTTTVQIGGLGLDAATSVAFNGAPALFTVINAGRIAAVVPPTATSGPIQIQLAGGAAPLVSPMSFTVSSGSSSGPSVATMTPTHGAPGTPVLLTGANLTGATSVSFGGVAGTNLSVGNGGATISVNVPGGAATGPVTVSTPAGGADAGVFAVDAPVLPVIDAFTPASGAPGTVVTITGAGVGAATEIRIGSAVMTGLGAVDANTVKVTVPIGAVTGGFTLVAPAGTATSTGSFTVDPLPPPPFADAGPNVQVVQGSTVTLDGSATVGATSLLWTQASGPPVTLSANNVAKPTFVFPQAFTTVSFQLLATNAGGSSVGTVTISAIPDNVTVTSAIYRNATKVLTVIGKTSIVSPNNSVTLHLGTVNGPTIAFGNTDATGGYAVNATLASAPTGPIVVTSSLGGVVTQNVTVK